MRQPKLIAQPTRVQAAGNKPKLIDEYIGRVNSGNSDVSVAHMRSPGGWQEPGQTPEFDEFSVVLRGMIRVEYSGGSIDVRAGKLLSRTRASGSATAPGAGGSRIFRNLRTCIFDRYGSQR
jgi:hypothetical protein